MPLVGLALLSGCADHGILDPAGPVAAGNRAIMLNALVIMLAIVVPTIIVSLAFAWWFRAGNARARRQPGFVYSGKVELVVWGIPLLVVLFLGGLIWIGSHALDPRAPLASQRAPVVIQVVSLDWKWLFVHPAAGVASVNRLVIPAGTPIEFRITSASVMNGFFVPRLGSMIYAMNGMESRLNLLADRPGVYRGISSHYSGAGFSHMSFTVLAVPPARYGAWVRRTRAAASWPTLDATAYARLARQGTAGAFDYRAVQPGLFDAVVMQRVSPASGPIARAKPGTS